MHLASSGVFVLHSWNLQYRSPGVVEHEARQPCSTIFNVRVGAVLPELSAVPDLCRQLYERFYDAFAQYGEPNIPVDKTFLQSPHFFELLERLRSYAQQHHRDHWVQVTPACLVLI